MIIYIHVSYVYVYTCDKCACVDVCHIYRICTCQNMSECKYEGAYVCTYWYVSIYVYIYIVCIYVSVYIFYICRMCVNQNMPGCKYGRVYVHIDM